MMVGFEKVHACSSSAQCFLVVSVEQHPLVCLKPFLVGVYAGVFFFVSDYRRKFRSQTSENMDRWKSRGGKNQRREEKRSKEERISKKRKSQKKEDAGARKGRKVANHYACQGFWNCYKNLQVLLAPQRRAIVHLSSGRMAAHPLL